MAMFHGKSLYKNIFIGTLSKRYDDDVLDLGQGEDDEVPIVIRDSNEFGYP